MLSASGASALTCFNTVLLLSLSTIKRFEDKVRFDSVMVVLSIILSQVFDFLKTLVQNYFEEKVTTRRVGRG